MKTINAMRYISNSSLIICLFLMILKCKSLYAIDVAIIFLFCLAFFGLELYLDGWLKRRIALYNQKARRFFRGVTDFDEFWTV